MLKKLPIRGAYIVEFKRHGDSRGYFNELFNCEKYDDLLNKKEWKQVSFSNSSKNVIRGLHCSPYGKFITCTSGSFYDVIADIRPKSPTYGRWCRILLTSSNCLQVYVPANCGHGFCTMEDNTSALYLQEGCFDPSRENDTHPMDPFINVSWPIKNDVTLSQKDKHAKTIEQKSGTLCLPKQKYLVIGANGQIGNALVEYLKPENCIGTSSKTSSDYMTYDIQNALQEGYTEFIFDCVRPSHVFICTGFTWVDGCETDEKKCNIMNHTGPLHICKIAKQFNCKPVWFSTDYVFDGKSGPYDETYKPNPINTYGKAKLLGEHDILSSVPETLIIRTNMVYGPDKEYKNFVCQILSGNLKTIPIDQYGTPVYSKDIAEACAKLTFKDTRGIVHVSGDEHMSRKEMVERIHLFKQKNEDYEYKETSTLGQKAKRPLVAGLKNNLVKQLIDWKPKSLEDSLKDWNI